MGIGNPHNHPWFGTEKSPKRGSEKRTNARAVLASINAAVGQDFHTLSTSQVTALLAEADRVRYQKPRGANGSRGRHFFHLIQRQAQKTTLDVEQGITRKLLGEIVQRLCLHEEIPPRLMYRALIWACERLDRQEADLRSVVVLASRIDPSESGVKLEEIGDKRK